MEKSVPRDNAVKSTCFTVFPFMGERCKVQKGSGYFSIFPPGIYHALYKGRIGCGPPWISVWPPGLVPSPEPLLGHVQGFGLQRHSGFIDLQVKENLLFFGLVFFSGTWRCFNLCGWLINSSKALALVRIHINDALLAVWQKTRLFG